MIAPEKTSVFGGLRTPRSRSVSRLIVGVLVTCLMVVQTATAAPGGDDHDHDHPEKGGPAKGGPKPAPGRGRTGDTPSRRGDEGCPVNPVGLADFANGERYDYANMVTYLTNPTCQGAARQISLAALSYGVTFTDKPPFRLDNFAKALPKVDLESAKRIEMSLDKSIPSLLRANPMSSSDLLPLLGQLSLLSPGAARATLANVIQQELYAGDSRILVEGKKGRDAAAADLARTLVRLGANESAIASEMAENVEDMALLAQADSLARIFRALSAAATMDASLVPTFNLSAGALNRGVQRGKKLFVSADKAALLTALFTAVRASMAGTGALEPGAAELNEALAALLGETPLTATNLRKLWKEAVKILTQSPSQTALAEAISLSLTPQVIFLLPEDMEQLLVAARSYPQVAGAIQANFLLAWNRVWNDLHDGRIKVKTFNRMKEKYFEPLVAEILDLDPYLIDSFWLREVTRRGLVQDEDIEKRFPRFVLAFLDRREKASKAAAVEPGPEPMLASMAENFAVTWTLNSVHVPALLKWVKKYEQ